MKVTVYAISKNEEKFADRWMDSVGEADEVVVLDTGSTDNTVQLLKSRGATVYKEMISPWRFDTARNRSLDLVSGDTDICVCCDIDEVFRPGWRDILEKAWRPNVKQAAYRYTWNFNDDGSEGTVFWIEKIHARRGFRWTHPVHEVLTYCAEEPLVKIFAEGIQLDHHADESKSRGQYLGLLELSVKEDPDDDRNMHYLGREYMFVGEDEKAIETLKRHLSMPKATWRDERCASMRFIARCCERLGNIKEAEAWHYRACAEGQHLREPFVDFAEFMYRRENYEGVIFACLGALEIKQRPRTYITEAKAWGSEPYDLLSIAYYYTGNREKAKKYALLALEYEPDNERIRQNYHIIAGEE